MSDIEPAKLKVTELRDELKKRGLDTKGNKPQLVKRLEKAIAAESGDAEADVSEADLSQATDTSLNESVQADASLNESAIQQAGASRDDSQSVTAAAADEATVELTPTTTEEQTVAAVVPAVTEEPPVAATVTEAPVIEEKPVVPAIPDEPVAESIAVEAVNEEVKEEVSAEPEALVESAAAQQESVPVAEVTTKPNQVKMEEVEPEATVPMETTVTMEEAPTDVKPEEAEEAKEAEPEVIKIEDSGTETGGETGMDVKESSEAGDRTADQHRERRKRSRSPSDEKHRSHRSRSRSPRRSRRSRSRSHSNERRHQRRSRSRSHERRRQPSRSPEKVEPMESDDWLASTAVQLDRYNSDLSLCIDESGNKAHPLTADAFGFMWTGAKATYGVRQGKICFEMKVLEHLNVDHLPPEEDNKHVVRVGFSASCTSLLLGEEKLSYGYGGTGKASTECRFTDYGLPFMQDDVITAYLDMTSDPVVISFAKNGIDLGTCFEVEASTLNDQALFPHVLTKNCSFECNFGQMESPFFPPKDGFVFINDIPVEERERGVLPPAKKEDCEMLMMCGLPGCGKTTWVGKHLAANPDKLYNVLGTNSIIDKMKVMGLPRKRNYAGRWDVLIEMSTKCLNKLLELASKRKRNYILDQTNVYPSAQRRKMRPFEGFQRKAVVIVPTDEEFKSRCDQRDREEGKEIPDSAVMEMKANFQLPEVGATFDEVEFVELQLEEARPLVEQYNKEGRAAQPPDAKRFRGGERERFTRFSDNRDRGGRDYNRPSRGGYSDNRRGGGGSYYNRDRDSGYSGGRGGGYSDRSGGGYQDRRRDQSGSSGGYNRDRKDYGRGGREASSWSSGGSRGYQQQGGWKSQGGGGYSQQQGGWKGYGQQQQQWGGQSGGYGGQWTGGQQDWTQQGYQQQSGAWGQQQWPGYGQQQSWPNQGSGYTGSYPGWNQAAAASTWPSYGQQQQGWGDSSGSGSQYQK
jgi:heterogeneous nuclear ribonucleoprotein U-like protein 1